MQRLWCVMECFVFLYVGGDRERIVVVPLSDGTAPSALAVRDAEAPIHAPFASFDASRATCFKPEDKEQLLGVVEAAFGSLAAFSAAVQRRFGERVQSPVGCSDRSAPTTPSTTASTSTRQESQVTVVLRHSG